MARNFATKLQTIEAFLYQTGWPLGIHSSEFFQINQHSTLNLYH